MKGLKAPPVDEAELARRKAREERFAKPAKYANVSTGPKIAHSGGKITSNRKEYVEKFISRKGGYENLSEEEKQALEVMKNTENCKPIVKTEKGVEISNTTTTKSIEIPEPNKDKDTTSKQLEEAKTELKKIEELETKQKEGKYLNPQQKKKLESKSEVTELLNKLENLNF